MCFRSVCFTDGYRQNLALIRSKALANDNLPFWYGAERFNSIGLGAIQLRHVAMPIQELLQHVTIPIAPGSIIWGESRQIKFFWQRAFINVSQSSSYPDTPLLPPLTTIVTNKRISGTVLAGLHKSHLWCAWCAIFYLLGRPRRSTLWIWQCGDHTESAAGHVQRKRCEPGSNA
jgi:hypothetical protein